MSSLPADVRRLFLYFFLMFTEEESARAASTEAFRELKRQRPSSDSIEHSTENLAPAKLDSFVTVLRNTWSRSRKKFEKKRIENRPQSPILKMDLAPWIMFRKNAREAEAEALIFTQIFEYDEPSIARQLQVSEGTLRARRLHGLLKLSQILHQHTHQKKKDA